MKKFNKSSGSFSGKKPFKKDGPFKKDRNASGDGKSGGYKKRSFGKRDDSEGSKGFGKDDRFKKKKPFNKEGGEGERGPRPFQKSGRDDFKKKPFRKRENADKDSYASEDKDTGRKSYKAKRSFTKNKELRSSEGFKKKTEGSFEKKEFRGAFDRSKNYKKNDKYSDKSSLKDKPRAKKSFDEYNEEDFRRIKHDELEEGKTFSRGYKKEFSKEDKKPRKTAASEGLTRLNKYLANAGIASRREADTLIKSGVVKVNGVPVTEMGFKVKAGDVVTYGDASVKSERKVYLLLNKPKDYITTVEDPQARHTVMELVAGACKERIYPVGRLDRNTTGLLLLTNDGELTKKLTHPKHDIKKIYHVTLSKGLKPDDFKSITEGVELEDGFIKADDLAFVGEGKKEVGIEIHSGRNRVVRRLFEHLGYDVLKLDRVSFAGLTKKDLPRGKYRFLTAKEVSFLQMIG
jgi:23S rRNA pseudouridine2605 synthase